MARIRGRAAKSIAAAIDKAEAVQKATAVNLAPVFEAYGLPAPVAEFRFDASRKWAFDYAWPSELVALEVEGGIYGRGKPCPVCNRRPPGAHSSIARLLSDMEKYNAAAVAGWRVLRVTPNQLDDGSAFALVSLAIRTGGAS